MTSFQLVNNSGLGMLILHEPEGFEFILPSNEEVTIQVYSVENSLILVHSIEKDALVVNIMDNKSTYKVFYKGEDVFGKYC